MATLTVPGADLYYEVAGSGPTLLLIAGGADDGRDFGSVAEALARHFTVVTYDTRGISRSRLHHPVDQVTIETEVADALCVLSQVTDAMAHVFGTSAGAQIALALAARRPDRVASVIAHEPPAVLLLPVDDPRRDLLHRVVDAYREQGLHAAQQAFAVGAGLGGPACSDEPPFESEAGATAMQAKLTRMQGNFEFFIARRMGPIGDCLPDLEALRNLHDRIAIGVGAASRRQLAHDTGLTLAAALDQQPVVFPGGHPGYATHPQGFARVLHQAILSRSPTR
ncbi:alpha/beta fold hydrolase [Amycolatopsis taiwanensis]|uniref:alpha/beta fold hydrolase n=1 Tax=Amycolatopsis taiwanensis TaxID=342230 RepID=UPI0004810904|nr:alpha/beta hydrolase [Amycolatopsis taiwanensis]